MKISKEDLFSSLFVLYFIIGVIIIIRGLVVTWLWPDQYHFWWEQLL